MSILIGISGGSGSGKTFLLNQLIKKFKSSELCALSMDHYYRPKDMLVKDENGMINFDLPSCIDHQRLLIDLLALLEGRTIQIKEYTFNNPNKNPVYITLNPAPIILLEGIFSFHFMEISKLLDLKIFIDCNAQLRLQRRLERDTRERAYPEAEIKYQWKNHVLPAHLLYLQPQQEIANLIIDGTHKNGVNDAYDAILKLKKHKR